MNKSKKINKQLVAMKLSGIPIPHLVIKANYYLSKVNGNVYFPNPVPDIARMTTQLDITRKALQLAESREMGTVSARNAEVEILKTMLKLLAGYVETIANADRPNAISIIESSGMSVRKTAERKPRVFSVKTGIAQGSVKLDSKATPRATYIYEMTTAPDDSASWKRIAVRLNVKYTQAGLTSGVRYYFRVAVIFRSVQSEWSPVLNVIIP